jgi:hypothetical protein
MVDFGGAFVTLTDYLGGDLVSVLGPEVSGRLVPVLAADMPLREMISALAALNHFAHYPEQAEPTIEFLRSALRPEPLARLDRLLANRQPFARQPVLRAMREVLADPTRAIRRKTLPGIAPIWLVHAVGDTFPAWGTSTTDRIGGWPSEAVLELVANYGFHEGQDRWALLVRTASLWRRQGHLAASHLGGRSAVDLLVEATELEPEDFLALGFALTAHAAAWSPATSQLLRLDAGLGMSPGRVAAFVKLATATPEELAARVAAQPRSTWDFLAFEKTPVLRFPEGFLVLDESLLWERVTTGLYWLVFDHLKASEGDAAALAWTRAWGDMVEAAVGESLARCCLAALGGTALFWNEDDLQAAYGQTKACDFVLDAGDSLLLFEVVSGQLKTGTRVDLARQAFDEDVQRLVMKKVRQLHAAATCLLQDEARLTGVRPSAPRRIVPVIVAAMGFPYVGPVVQHVDALAGAEGLLTDARIEPLSILDLRELDLVEGKSAAGTDPASLVNEWQRATGRQVSFWNWATTWPGGAPSRPSRITAEGTDVANELRRRLRLADDPDPDRPWNPEE